MKMRMIVWMAAVALPAFSFCGGEDGDSKPDCAGLYPVDPACYGADPGIHEELRLNMIQMKGTHNSYHVAPPGDAVADWNYTHAPLAVQLEEQGVRQFELDIHWDPELERFRVYHVPFVDTGSRCEFFTECLEDIREWSDAHLAHHPIFIYIESKAELDFDPQTYEPIPVAPHMDAFDAEIRSVFLPERLITPDDIQGDYPDLMSAVTDRGWPALDRTRGRVVVMLFDDEEEYEVCTRGGTSLAGRALFCATDDPTEINPILKRNNPTGDFEFIQQLVREGRIVRTMVDGSGPETEDTSKQEDGRNSGAQMLSTDYPMPGMAENGYFLDLPGGTPSRCNPLVAPMDCTSELVEDLQP